MPLLADRVRETSATTGTGTLTLAGAVAGYQGFNAAFANADTVYYVIQYATEWEVGIGTVGTGTLSRDSVLASSNADALVPFSAGTKDVFVAYVAERAVTTSDAATLTNKTIDSITNLVGADHIHYKIKANATITKGQTLKAVGYNPGNAAIEVVPISSASDIAVGIAYQNLASGDFGAAINTGLLIGVKTDFAGWALGDVLYPDPSTGGLTKTKPTSGTYQACAYIMRVQSNNGVLLCEFTEPQQVLASTNTANTAVLRDGSGNFAAGTVTAALTGNASTATALATARTINGVSFNGTADITVTAAAGTLSGATLAAGVTASSLTSVGTLGSLTVTNPITGSVTGSSGSTTGNAATATTLQTARTINGVSFNGSADITVTAAAGTLSGSTLASGVTASSLTSVGTLSSLTVSGNLTVDTNTLFVDAVNNRVGIGTASPTRVLTVAASAMVNSTSVLTSGFYDGLAISGYDAIGWSGSNSLAIGGYRTGQWSILELYTGGTKQVTLNGPGNLGLGVTPSTWSASFTAMQIRGLSLFGSTSDSEASIGGNVFVNSSGQFAYRASTVASRYQQVNGTHAWYTAPSGTAGNAITFTQALTLHASGGHSLGTTTDPGAGVFLANTGVQAPRLSTATATSFGSALAATAYRIYADAIYGAAIVGFGTTSDVALIGRGGNIIISGTDNGGPAKIGFYATSPITKPTVTGSRGANAALASLLTALSNLGLLTDSST
jgi:hypothetical protein